MHRLFPSLRTQVQHAIILAYEEDVGELERALAAEGFHTSSSRASYTPAKLKYSRTIRCLMNHASAWRLAQGNPGLTLIVEADFVPCRGFGSLPLPFDPSKYDGKAWAFLYGGGPRYFEILPDGSLPGHAACPVAYVVSPKVAAWLVEYADMELARHGDLTCYSLWDTQFQWHTIRHGARFFMPFRQYGEHGGISNPEHRNAGVGVAQRFRVLKLLGLCRNHHADVLWDSLMFLPAYAKGSRWRFYATRLEAKLIGWAKLATRRAVAPQRQLTSKELFRLRWTCLRRLLTPY